MPDVNMRTQSFRVYRANKDGNGAACQIELSWKDDKTGEGRGGRYFVFLTLAQQGGDNENGDATFQWKEGIVVKLDPVDLGEFLSVLTGKKESLGTKGSLFHESPGGGNKIIQFAYNTERGGFYLVVSQQDAEKKDPARKIGHSMSAGEAEVLTELLKVAVVRLYGW